MGPNGSAPDIFNVSVIDDGKREIFVTEGAIDALSVIEAGADAIALNSASNAGRLVEMLEKNRPKAAFILCLDNDTAGKRATETLRDGLTRLNIPFAVADICGGGKGSERGTMQRQSPFPISGREGEEACNHKAG